MKREELACVDAEGESASERGLLRLLACGMSDWSGCEYVTTWALPVCVLFF